MLEKIVVAAMIVAALVISLRSLKKVFSGEKGCGGGCACSGKKKKTCGDASPVRQGVEIGCRR